MKVLIGPPNSGKSEQVISRVIEALAERRWRVMLIVPSSTAASVVERRLQSSDRFRSISTPRQVLATFPSLYTNILADARIQPAWLKSIERERLLRQVITGLAESGQLTYFHATAGMRGVTSSVAGLIDELWRSGTTPDQFARVVESRGAKDHDLALIYESYSAALKSLGAVDSESAGVAALDVMSNADSDSIRSINNSYSLVVADGFDFYTPVQVRLLALLAARGAEVVATLTYEEGRAVHLWQKPTMERLARANTEFVHCSRATIGEIEQAAARLMIDRVSGSCGSNGDAIQILSAPDRAAEVRSVAREVKRLVVEEGFALGDTSIICRSLSQYAHHLSRVFRECSVPITLDCAVALSENPLVIAIERLLSLHAGSFARRASIDCLRSPYFDFSPFGFDDSAIDLLDRVSLSKNITRERNQWLDGIESVSNRDKHHGHAFDDEEGTKTEEELTSLYSSLAEGVRNFFAEITPPHGATRGEYVHWILGLIERFRVKQCAEKGETSSRDLEALGQFVTLLEIISSSAGVKDADILWIHFFKELQQEILTRNFGPQSDSTHSVIAQEAHAIRPSRFRAVFILGLVEGEFPARSAETAPYTLVEREELQAGGIDLPETCAGAGADLTQFYKAMTRAAERLYLSYPRTDLDGGELLPSYLVEEVSSVAAAREIRIAQSAARGAQLGLGDVASLAELASVAARAMRESFDCERAFPDPHDREAVAADALLDSKLASWKATKRGARLEMSRMRGRGRWSRDGLIREPKLIDELKRMFGPDHLWSASQINDYGTCPFRFYAKHALRLSPSLEPIEGFGPNHLGNAYHQILESLHRRLLAEQIQITEVTAPEAANIAEQITEEELEKMLANGSIRKGPLWEFEKAEIKKQLARLLDAEAEWNAKQPARPIHFERNFGDRGAPPLVIKSEEGDVRLRGVIDRIDEREDGLVVIDYKTSRTLIRHSEAVEGRNLQLPIYAMAASRVIDTRAKVVSAYYLHIHSRKKGSELPHKNDEQLSLEAMIAHAEERILEYVRKARTGAFPVKPNNDRCYPYCEFDVMCRIQSIGDNAIEDD